MMIALVVMAWIICGFIAQALCRYEFRRFETDGSAGSLLLGIVFMIGPAGIVLGLFMIIFGSLFSLLDSND